MEITRLKIWLNFYKFILGTLFLGGLTLFIDSSIKKREVEIKEMELFGRYIDYALTEDVGIRKRFAEYFASVTSSKDLRDRWNAYLIIVNQEFKQINDSIANLTLLKNSLIMELDSFRNKLTKEESQNWALINRIEKLKSEINTLEKNIIYLNQQRYADKLITDFRAGDYGKTIYISQTGIVDVSIYSPRNLNFTDCSIIGFDHYKVSNLKWEIPAQAIGQKLFIRILATVPIKGNWEFNISVKSDNQPTMTLEEKGSGNKTNDGIVIELTYLVSRL